MTRRGWLHRIDVGEVLDDGLPVDEAVLQERRSSMMVRGRPSGRRSVGGAGSRATRRRERRRRVAAQGQLPQLAHALLGEAAQTRQADFASIARARATRRSIKPGRPRCCEEASSRAARRGERARGADRARRAARAARVAVIGGALADGRRARAGARRDRAGGGVPFLFRTHRATGGTISQSPRASDARRPTTRVFVFARRTRRSRRRGTVKPMPSSP